jgi:hypothetical protein
MVTEFPTFYENRYSFPCLQKLCLEPDESSADLHIHFLKIPVEYCPVYACLPRDLFVLVFPATIVCTFTISPMCAVCPAHLILLDLVTLNI